jgi:hypothetical protein
VVVNHGTMPLHLAMYAADGFTTKEAGSTWSARTRSRRAWVRTDRPDLAVRPGESAEVPFTVALPENAAPGEYMGGIVTSPAQANGIDANRRLGIRIRLRVGGSPEPSLSVSNLRVRYSARPTRSGRATSPSLHDRQNPQAATRHPPTSTAACAD